MSYIPNKKQTYIYKLTQFLPTKPDQLGHLGYVPGSRKKIKITIDVGRQSTRQPFSPGSWRRPWRGAVWIHGVTFLAAHVRLVMRFQEITTRHDAPQGRCVLKGKLFENRIFFWMAKCCTLNFSKLEMCSFFEQSLRKSRNTLGI